MMPEQKLRRAVHGGLVQPGLHMPDAVHLQRRRLGAVEDDVAVAARPGGEAGIPAFGGRAAAQHGDGVGLEVKIHRLADAVGREIRQLDLHDHRQGMYPGICAPGGDGLCHLRPATEARGGFLDHLLDGQTMLLTLPAHEGRAIILDFQRPQAQ